jgi:hypothetical protein
MSNAWQFDPGYQWYTNSENATTPLPTRYYLSLKIANR